MSETYTTTFSGRHVAPTFGVPALIDIAVGLSRIVRFGGQGKHFFSVLAHSLWMRDLYVDRFKNNGAHELAILLHDAGEAVTSDIPSPMKSGEQKGYQRSLDERIFDRYFAAFGGFKGYREAHESAIKALDYRALLTEYWEVGPAQPCYLVRPDPADRDFFRYWLEHNAPLWQSEVAAQDEYVRRLMRLL